MKTKKITKEDKRRALLDLPFHGRHGSRVSREMLGHLETNGLIYCANTVPAPEWRLTDGGHRWLRDNR